MKVLLKVNLALTFLPFSQLFQVLATVIQKTVRGFVAYSQYSRLYATSIAMQSLVRRNIAMKNLFRACSAVTTLSCWIRCVFAKAELRRLKREKASTLLQTR